MRLLIVKILLFIAIIAMLMVGALAYVNFYFYKVSKANLENANSILLNTTELLSLLKDGETGVRGYVLTQDKSYLEPYLNFKEEIVKYKKYLLTNTQEVEVITDDLHHLLFLVSQKEEILEKIILVNDKAGFEEALKLIKTNQGKEIMDKIRIGTAEIFLKEKQHFNRVSNNYESQLFLMNNVKYGIQIFVIIITAVAIYTINSKAKANKNLIKDLNNSKEFLEEKVKLRTFLLENQNQEILFQKEQLRIINEDKNKFIAIASHDLKSPMNRIKGFINIIQASPSSTVEANKEYFNFIEATIVGMQKLLNSLLDVNKIEQGKQQINLVPLDIVHLTRKAVMMFEKQASGKEITMFHHSETETCIINSDNQILLQIFENLISNALKFSQRGTKVSVLVKKESAMLKVIIIDEGPGILPEEMDLLFGKFQKLSNQPTGGEGSTGLGLYIVKDLVECLGSKIYCDSKINKGTTFTIDFPLA